MAPGQGTTPPQATQPRALMSPAVEPRPNLRSLEYQLAQAALRAADEARTGTAPQVRVAPPMVTPRADPASLERQPSVSPVPAERRTERMVTAFESSSSHVYGPRSAGK